MRLFDGPFPANMPEDQRWKEPRPNHIDVEHKQAGNIPPSSDPVRNGAKPYKKLRG